MFAFQRLLAALRLPDSRAARDPFSLAVRRLESGDAAGALHALSALLEGPASPAMTNEERARIVNKRGIAHVRLGQRAEALQDFTLALDLVPRFAPALTNVGNLLLEDGVLEDAIAHYEAAIRSDESYAVAHLNLAVAYRQAGRHAAAVRELRLAHRLEGRALLRRTLR